MAQNFLYMFEFVVDDLLITRPNTCAPEEFPTCCEISFRSSVFVSICDREFGSCVENCAPKCGKCCLFSLESPVTEKDRLLIHIYKKRNNNCKFLMGATDLSVKALFDKVTESFNIDNPNWMKQLSKHIEDMPDPKSTTKSAVIANDCDDDIFERAEQMCPASETAKRLLPLFNMKNMQTGNLVLIMRLVCNGPAIVSSFPFARMCSTACAKKPKQCTSCPIRSPSEKPAILGPCTMPDPCKREEPKPKPCQRYFACNADKGCPCDECEDDCDRECPTVNCSKKPSTSGNNGSNNNNSTTKKRGKSCSCRPKPPSSQPDPCKPMSETKDTCLRYFNNNDSEKCCTCEECVDECEADEFSEEPCCCEDPCCIPPCFITPTKPDPGPEAYEEFEACLNGSGLTIRLLKDTHQVESIKDGTDSFQLEDSGSDCDKCLKENEQVNPQSFTEMMKKSSFVRNQMRRRTTGNIINNSKLPKIRANIKYAGNENCFPTKYHIPFSKIKRQCDSLARKTDYYRKRKMDECEAALPPLPPTDMRNCCLQVDPQDIKAALKGINQDTRKKGIEVCYKACDDTDSDVFLVKLGSKQRCKQKKNQIEIELKTPKQPYVFRAQKVTTETQIDEEELDAALTGVCKKKKGKKSKKGKK